MEIGKNYGKMQRKKIKQQEQKRRKDSSIPIGEPEDMKIEDGG